MTAKQKRNIREAAVLGELDLVVGTHALLTEEVKFFRLALVITDEQHRFGVAQRAALSGKAGKDLRPHVLVMSATPIPRTLALMVYGELELSVIDELPPGRKPVATYIIGEDKRARLNRFIQNQVHEGRQVYLVCPMVEDGESMAIKAAEQYGAYLQNEIFPELRLAVIHGKMKAKEKERIMEAFVRGEIQVLVSTTVIEVGVDVPNATLMVVENAERFGLSQLHQLRGRVGRGDHPSYCVLVSDTKSMHSMERLRALAATTDGFRIAEEDLKLRGPGDFFGSRQHGLPQLKIADLAGDMRLLKEAQEASQILLEQDPKLEMVCHQMLREKVMRLFEENRDSFN
jgi:ATP-dependent DNA helicase RecG